VAQRYPRSVCIVAQRYPRSVCNMAQRYPRSVCNVAQRYPRSVCIVAQRYPRFVCNVAQRYPRSVCNVAQRYPRSVCNVAQRYPRSTSEYLQVPSTFVQRESYFTAGFASNLALFYTFYFHFGQTSGQETSLKICCVIVSFMKAVPLSPRFHSRASLNDGDTF